MHSFSCDLHLLITYITNLYQVLLIFLSPHLPCFSLFLFVKFAFCVSCFVLGVTIEFMRRRLEQNEKNERTNVSFVVMFGKKKKRTKWRIFSCLLVHSCSLTPWKKDLLSQCASCSSHIRLTHDHMISNSRTTHTTEAMKRYLRRVFFCGYLNFSRGL